MQDHKIDRLELPTNEEVLIGKERFLEHQKKNYGKAVKTKKVVHGDITKIHLSAGKKKKIRNVDIVGALSNLEGMTGQDIGIIDVQDGFSYVDILNGKGNIILKKHKEIKLKGKLVKVSNAKN